MGNRSEREIIIQRILAMHRLAEDSGATEGERENARHHIALLMNKYKIMESDIEKSTNLISHYERLNVGEFWPRGLANIVATLVNVAVFTAVDNTTNSTNGVVFAGSVKEVYKAIAIFRNYYNQISELSKDLRKRMEQLPKMPNIQDCFGNNRNDQFINVWNVFTYIGQDFNIKWLRQLPPADSKEWQILVDSWGQGVLFAMAQQLLNKNKPTQNQSKTHSQENKSSSTVDQENKSSSTVDQENKSSLVLDDRASRVNNARNWFANKYAGKIETKPDVTRRNLDPEYYNIGINDINKIKLIDENQDVI